MRQSLKARHMLFVSVGTVGFVLAGCPPANNQPVLEQQEDLGNIEVEEVVANPNDPGNPNNNNGNPPVVIDEEDCQALPYNGAPINCDVVLSPANYCGTVAPNGELDFGIVNACGQCDAQYFQNGPPPGESCALNGGVDPIENVDPPVDLLVDSTCKTCHAPAGYDGLNSIEDPHPWASVECVDCHGGDGTATNPVFAHVCPPPEVGNRQQQVLDARAFFLSFTTAGVQLLPDYTCPSADGTPKATRAVDWLMFRNPGSVRAYNVIKYDADGAKGCGYCHGATAENPDGTAILKGGDVMTKYDRSVMANATGLNSGSRHGAGIENAFPDRRGIQPQLDWNTQADFGATDVANANYDPANPNRVVGEVGSLRMAEVVTTEGFQYDASYTANDVNQALNGPDFINVFNTNADNYPNGIVNVRAAQIYQEILNQACTGCHGKSNYNNNRAGDYRSGSCTACHYQYGTLGRSSSNDPNIRQYEPVDPNNLTPGERSHALDHRIRNVAKLPGQGGVNTVIQGITDSNCITCHEGSNRTVAQFHGYRLDQNQDLQNNNFYPSQNTVEFTNSVQLFGENQFYNNRNVNQWIQDEIWQADVDNLFVGAGQDETPADVHYEAGMGCIDCHGTGSTHGRGEIYSRMKVATHQNDMLCETCHGTIDNYADSDGTHLLDQGGYAIDSTYVDGVPQQGNFWLVSKVNGSVHYIPQTKDTVDGSLGLGLGKQYPNGAARQGAIYSPTASAAMGRYSQNPFGSLQDGLGPYQPNMDPANYVVRNNFSHTDAISNTGEQGGLECYTCHASWQNNCIGCHLDANYDNNPANFFFSFTNGQQVYFNFAANFVYQNPTNFMLGINDRGRISPYQGLHRFWSYTDINNDTSNRIATADRNGLGFDPQLENPNRNNLPALQNQSFTPHSIRGRPENGLKGGRGCNDCHFYDANNTTYWDQQGQDYANFHNILNNEENYAAAIPFNVQQAYGLGTNLWLFDADGNPVFETNNTPVYDLDRIVEADGTSNTSHNHPMMNVVTDFRYQQFQDMNGAAMARPLTGVVLEQRLLNLNLTDVYYYNATPGEDPANTGSYTLNINDFNYFGQ